MLCVDYFDIGTMSRHCNEIVKKNDTRCAIVHSGYFDRNGNVQWLFIVTRVFSQFFFRKYSLSKTRKSTL